MPGRHYIGPQPLSVTKYEKAAPITGIILWVDDENCYEAGDETGTVIEQDCPYASQAMANALLSALQGYEYQPLEADGARVVPTAELGDGITVNGVYTQLAYQNIRFSTGEVMDVAAPGQAETLHEYKTEGETTRKFTHQIAETRSIISKTSEEIMLAVESEIDDLSSSITIQLNSITSQVTGLNSQVSTISQKVDNITLSVSNGTESSYITLTVGGVQVGGGTVQFTGNIVFASDLTDGYTEISGDNILTGEVSAEYILLGGEMRVYEDTSRNADLGGYIGYVTSYDFNGNRTYGMGMIEAVSNNQMVATDGGVRMTTDSGEVVVATNITLDTNNSVNVYVGNRFTSNVDLVVTSDRRKKDEILYDVAEKYLPLFDKLNPASFLLKDRGSDRHLGFIAQDVEESMNELGMPLGDLAALSIDEDGNYGLSYGEFTAMLTAKIQDMDRRLKALEV